MNVRVLFFARGREVSGTSETDIELLEGADSVALERHLLEKYPGLSEIWNTCVFARNQEYIKKGDAVPLKDGDEIAVIPPISGG
ncbi:hypothetical protein BSKO_10159 [Bryopsis sp. KO-2023]|nr:hypothetical protein BSKO_10159 [Bryopsis sp. KO-2023]